MVTNYFCFYSVGDTDGTYKGKRLMYTPSDQGKFYKLRELTSVLNVKVSQFIYRQKIFQLEW